MKMAFSLLIFYISLHIILSTQNIPEGYEVAPWYLFKPSVITYSFDDGSYNHLAKAVPLLDKYNLKATFNLITSIENDWKGYKAAAENGHEIASHTVSHSNLNSAGENELSQSKQIIGNNIGQECVTLAYPNCLTGDKTLMSKYYISGRTCSGQFVSSNPSDMFEISSIIVGATTSHNSAQALNALAENAAQQNKWVVFLIHGVDGDGGYSPISSSELDQHFAYVKQQDKWWIATFKDVSKYIVEANNLVINEAGNGSNYMVDVSCQYKTGITQLNVPVTIARKVSCSNPIVKQNGSQINSVPFNGKVIFDVIPGNKYTIQCQ